MVKLRLLTYRRRYLVSMDRYAIRFYYQTHALRKDVDRNNKLVVSLPNNKMV